MRTGLIGTIAALALASTTARAADVYGGPATYAPYAYRWTGPYVGGNLGYRWGALSNSGAKPSGIAGGAQGGYNWQFGPIVLGGEADLQFSNASDTFANYKFSNPWFGTVRGRAGYAFNNILFYGTAGLAFGELRGLTFGGISDSHTNAGWTAGVGAEFGFGQFGLAQHWSAKIEYLYVDLSDSQFVITGTQNGYRFGLVRAGVNYHF